MFEYVRTHQRLMQFILLLFIVPSFALVGVSSYLGGGNGDAVASVAGVPISQQEFDNALRSQMDQLRQQMGAQFNEAMFNTVEAKKSVLDKLIVQRVLKAEAKKEKLSITDTELQQTILAFPGLTLADGTFDYKGYKTILASRGLTPTMYESGLKQDLALQQLTSSIQDSAFVPKTVIAHVDSIMGQQREIQSLEFKTAEFVGQVTITDAMMKDYYDKHGAQFAAPELAKINYIVLSGDAIAASMTVSDNDIKAYYDQNSNNFRTDEQRRASHILIKADKNATAAEQAAAKEKAQQILALVRKRPADFAQLAKQNSQDEGSAKQGGDLDFFGKGMMLKPFEDVAFKLKQGEISDLVKTDFGYHIIYLTAIKPATLKPLAEVRDQISAEIRKHNANKQFSEMAETFTNTVYEQSGSLKPAADKLKLTIESASNITRDPKQANTATPFLSHPQFLKALFSEDVIKNKHNTEAIEVAPNTLVSAHIVEYKPASKRPFDEVKDLVTMFVKLAESEALAKKAGEAKLAALSANSVAASDLVGFGKSKLISRTQQEGLPSDAFRLLMNAEVSKLPKFVGVNLPGQGYTIYRINKIQQSPPDAARTASLSKEIEGMLGSEELYEFVEMLKQSEKVNILKPLTAGQANTAS